MSRPRGLQRRFQSSRATRPALTWPGARSLDRYASLRYGKHRPVDAQLALLARGARAALPAREPRRAARRQRDPGVRGADAGAGDRRRAAGRTSPHRRLRRLHLERAADRRGDPAAEGARAGHRRRHRRAGSEPRSRGAGDLPARRSRRHRVGRRDVRAAGGGPAERPATVEPGARRRTAAAGARSRFRTREYTDADLAHRTVYVEASRGCPFKCEFCLSALDRTAWPFPLEPLLARAVAPVRTRRASLQVRRPHVQPQGRDLGAHPRVLPRADRGASRRSAVPALRTDPGSPARRAEGADRALPARHAAVRDRHPDLRRRDAATHFPAPGQRGAPKPTSSGCARTRRRICTST